jgi:hypothetical protein
MFRSVIAGLIVSIWLGVLGVEMCEEMGLFAFANQQTAEAADEAVAGLGQAIRGINHPHFIIAKCWPSIFTSFQLSDSSPSFEPLALSQKHKLAATVPRQAIYKLYHDLRI